MVLEGVAAEVVLLVAGLAVLYVGAEGLVRGAAGLAMAMGVTTVVVGLTVVAFVTSAPELVVGAVAAFEGAEGIALGNVVGSNIANVGLILGVAAILRPLQVRPEHVAREVLVVLVAAIVVWAMALDGVLGLVDGALLLAGMAAFLIVSFRAAKSGRHAVDPDAAAAVEAAVPDEARQAPDKDGRNVLLLVAGLAGVVAGAWLTVEAASGLAARVGVGEVVVGLTVVAVGTSLPELATSAVASWRREMDISIGNVIGSNVFNTFGVLGVVAVIAPLRVDPGTLSVGFPVMLLFSAALLPLLKSGFELDRWKGAVLLAGFVAFWAVVVWTRAAWVVG